MKRRGGKPNRRGGAFSRGGGRGGGRGQGRGRGRGGPPQRSGGGQQHGGGVGGWSSCRKKDDYDLDDLMDGPVVNNPQYSSSTRDRPDPAPVKSRPKVRVEMQQLTMNRENQEMVKEMLQSLRLEDTELYSEDEKVNDFWDQDSEPEYDELDHRTENQYWMSDNKLVVQEATCNQLPTRMPDEKGCDQQVINIFAVRKLQRCGFSKEHCFEALQVCDGDAGAALEYLLCDLYDLPWTLDQDRIISDTADQDLLLAKEDEKMALQSMYDSAFEERIPGKVWLLNLELSELEQVLYTKYRIIKPSSSTSEKQKSSKTKNKICPFFLKGKCKFQNKCRFSHASPKEQSKDIPHPIYDNLKEMDKDKPPQFTIEIRFPLGNRYPEEAPLIAFTSLIEGFPAHAKLNFSIFLMNQAKDAALDQLPCVFTLVSSLEDIQLLEELFTLPSPFALRSSFSRKKTNSEILSEPTESSSDVKDFSFKIPESGREKIDSPLIEKSPQAAKINNPQATKHYSNISKDHDSTKTQRNDYNSRGDLQQLKRMNDSLQMEFMKKQKMKDYQKMLVQRQNLPAWDMQDLITEVIRDNQVVVISGMTGCGKTTQVPQFILDEALQQGEFFANIVCTQPRRISAMAVAQRVADERCEKLGKSVGYKIRLENVSSSQTRLLFCTTGIILRRLESDPLLEGITHIVIDEVHERSEESDFLLMILRKVLQSRHDLKVILMSATLNAKLFSDYFFDCPVIEIPGRTFPVQQFFIEDAVEFTNYKLNDKSPFARPMTKTKSNPSFAKGKARDLILDAFDEDEMEDIWESNECAANNRVGDMGLSLHQLKLRYEKCSQSTINTLHKMDFEKINIDLIVGILEWIVSSKNKFEVEGAILVFMPGFAEIQSLYDSLLASSEFGYTNKHRYKIIPLHSTLSSEEQNAVFKKPKDGIIKIVIATNIAETSITIDDIVYVVDAGRMKEKRYDQGKSMESLETVWVSRANALQRQGRAGRVQEGICFHLFTSHHFKYHMKQQPIPEIQRAPLEQLVLKIKMLHTFKDRKVKAVLENLIEAPSDEAIIGAIRRLQDLGALDQSGELSALGYHLGSLPVDVRIGKLMLYGAIFRCLDSALTIAAALSFKSPFVSPFGLKQEADEKKKSFAMGQSDYLTILNAYKAWMEVKKRGSHRAYNFCKENFLSFKTLEMLASLKQQYVELLSDIGFIRSGIRLRDVLRAGRGASDGVAEITGVEGNMNADNWRLMSGLLVAALYPNIVQVCTPETRYHESSAGAVIKAPKSEELRIKTKMDGYVSIHPSSVNFQESHYPSPYLVYHEKVKTTKIYIRDCSMVSVYQLLLFGGGSISIDLLKGDFIISVCDGWILFRAASSQVAELVRDLRQELDQLMSDKISQPGLDLLTCPRGSKIIHCIVSLVTSQW